MILGNWKTLDFRGSKVDGLKKRSLQRLEIFQASKKNLEDLHPGNDHIHSGNLT